MDLAFSQDQPQRIPESTPLLTACCTSNPHPNRPSLLQEAAGF